ncbi:MAG: hypothetical protein MJE68_14195, partial [Proteobacteria bacterium]|nr:hypothetical protein [Pseudomonadota bacterium]
SRKISLASTITKVDEQPSLNAGGRVEATWEGEGIQSISFMWWYKKQIHIEKYLDTREIDIPNLHARSRS